MPGRNLSDQAVAVDSVAVACFGDYHTLDIAAQLARMGGLQKLISNARRSQIAEKGIPLHLVDRPILALIAYYLLRSLFGAFNIESRRLRFIYWLFDWEVSQRLKRLRPSMFWGWAAMCAKSFETCRKLGITRLVYEGAVHIKIQDQVHRDLSSKGFAVKHVPAWQTDQREREYQEANFVIVESEFARSTFPESQHAKVIVLRPGVNLEKFYPSREEKADNLRFLMVYPSYRKGVADLIAAWRKAGEPGELVLAGHADRGVAELANGGKIRLTGTFEHSRMKQLCSGSDVFLMPTYWDGGPRAILEALACGVPVICSKSCIGPDLADDSGCVRLVSAGDVEGLACCIEEARNNKALLSSLRRKSRELAENKLDWQSNFLQFIETLTTRDILD